MKAFLAGLALGLGLGAGVAYVAQGEAARPLQLPPSLPGEGSCPPEVYLFRDGQFFRLLPSPREDPGELIPIEPAPNPFGGS